MKEKQKNTPLGKRSMEAAGSLAPDLEGQSKSCQHVDRSHAGEMDGGRMHRNRAEITPHLGRKGGEY